MKTKAEKRYETTKLEKKNKKLIKEELEIVFNKE